MANDRSISSVSRGRRPGNRSPSAAAASAVPDTSGVFPVFPVRIGILPDEDGAHLDVGSSRVKAYKKVLRKFFAKDITDDVAAFVVASNCGGGLCSRALIDIAQLDLSEHGRGLYRNLVSLRDSEGQSGEARFDLKNTKGVERCGERRNLGNQSSGNSRPGLPRWGYATQTIGDVDGSGRLLVDGDNSPWLR